jgi:UDP-glucose:(heptosyl)LPS alpha-1,3-glucosyltransferase
VNVGFVTHNYDRSEGTGGYAVELVTRLAGSHDLTLYAAGIRTPPPAGVTVVEVPALTGRAYPTILSYPRAFARVRRAHELVHAQGWVTDDADVVTSHIVLAAWRRAARAHGVRPPLGERLLGGWVARREGALLRRARRVIAPSRRAADDIRGTAGRDGAIEVIPHGCDRTITPTPRALARQRCGVPDPAFVAAYMGDARKGLDVAVGALVHAADAHLLVRSGNSPGAFRALAARLGVAGRLHWAPADAGAEDVFGAADVILQPTIYDTFGMVVGEALALGLPVITSDRSGVAELIENGTSGLVVGPWPEEAGLALQQLARDPALRQRLAAAGRAVAARYTWDETARRTAAVYAEARWP